MAKRARSESKNCHTITQYFSPKSAPQQIIKQQNAIIPSSRTGIYIGKRSIIRPPKQPKEEEVKKYKISSLVNEEVVQKLFDKSGALQKFLSQIQRISQQNCRLLIQRFLKNDKYRPWVDKYMPKHSDQLIKNPSIEKILKWIKAYTSYKTTGGVDTEDSFINDNSISMREQQITSIISKEKWQFKALIVQGRQGIGKYTSIKCLANTYKMKTFQCTNETDRLKYCKEHYQSTKSHCFKKQENQKEALPKSYFKVDIASDQICNKLHIIHEINQVYPEDKKGKFHQLVEKFIKQSQVPVIITCSDYKIPKSSNFASYDIIEMQEPNVSDIARFIWAVFHIEFILGRLYKNQTINKEDAQPYLLKYFQKVQFLEILTIKEVQSIVFKMASKINKILTFFQQYFLENNYNVNIKYQTITQLVDKESRHDFCQTSSTFSIHNMSKFIIHSPISTLVNSSIDTLNQNIRENIITMFEKQIFFKTDLDCSSQPSLRLMIPMQTHEQILSTISSKLYKKSGVKLACNQLYYSRLLGQKIPQRRLRSNRAFEQIPFMQILEKYLLPDEVAYVLNIFEQKQK